MSSTDHSGATPLFIDTGAFYARFVEHVFTFDPDHFRTLGFTAVPDDTGDDSR